MGFVENEVIVLGNDLAIRAFAHDQIGEQQVVVDDDDVAVGRAVPQSGYVTTFELGALFAGAILTSRGDAFPKIEAVGRSGNLRPVSRFRHARPAFHRLEMARFLEEAERRLHRELGVSRQAEIVPAAFHETGGERYFQRLPQQRNVLVEELLLKVFRARRDYHSLPRQHRGYQVCEGLPRASARFHEKLSAAAEHVRDRRRHGLLRIAKLETR